jgi:hypothetical protein
MNPLNMTIAEHNQRLGNIIRVKKLLCDLWAGRLRSTPRG